MHFQSSRVKSGSCRIWEWAGQTNEIQGTRYWKSLQHAVVFSTLPMVANILRPRDHLWFILVSTRTALGDKDMHIFTNKSWSFTPWYSHWSLNPFLSNIYFTRCTQQFVSGVSNICKGQVTDVYLSRCLSVQSKLNGRDFTGDIFQIHFREVLYFD